MRQLDELLMERTCKYGTFEDNANRSNNIFHAIVCNAAEIASRNAKPVHIEALRMISLKISRLVNGGINDPEGWLDIAGYAMLVFKHLSVEQENIKNIVDEPDEETIKFMEGELMNKMTAYGGSL